MLTAARHHGSMGFLTVRQLGKLCAIKCRNPAAFIEHPKFILFVFVGKLGHFRILILFQNWGQRVRKTGN